jgi:diguanylate cyclase (GGDEF)-like protein
VLGDEALIYIANIIKSSVKKEDILVRIGGDEFGVIIINPKNKKKTLEIISQRLIKKMNRKKGNFCSKLTFSIGGYLARGECESEEIVDRADEAMYKAKKSGKNQAHIV